MIKVTGLLVLSFLIFATCVLAAPPNLWTAPGIAPDPGLGDDLSPITYPNIMGTWSGKGRDINKDKHSLPEHGGPYDVELLVFEQDGSKFLARFLAEGWSGEFYTSQVFPGVAGHITADGEMTMFGGWERTPATDEPEESYRISIKAKLYKNPVRSIRGSWEAFKWGGNYRFNINSGNFVVYPEEHQTDQ